MGFESLDTTVDRDVEELLEFARHLMRFGGFEEWRGKTPTEWRMLLDDYTERHGVATPAGET